jgi:hypothetical protein
MTARLAAMIAPNNVYRTPAAPFRGFWRGRHFEAEPIVPPFRIKAFQPIITGDVVPTARGTEVRVRMRLHAAVSALLIIFFGFLFIAGVLSLLSATTHPRVPNGSTDGAVAVGTALAVFATVVLGAYGTISVAFWTEVTKTRSLLRDGLGIADADVEER